MALLTQSNGFLSNHFRDIVAPYYEPFYSVKIVNDFSGAYKNPHWGTHGCTVFWGGGHAATNDNMVAIAEYGTSSISFKRVLDPTPWFGAVTDSNPGGSNSIGDVNSLLNAFLESTIDGKPASPHSWGSGDIIGPEYGGAANGTLIQVFAAAVGYTGNLNGANAHELPFARTTEPSSSLAWVRVSEETVSPLSFGAPPHTAFVGPQQRIYIQTNHSFGFMRWYDRQTARYVTGTGACFGFDGADGFDSGSLFYVPRRGLLVCMYPVSGNLVIQWADVTVNQPTLGGTATLSSTLKLAMPWSAGCWCPDNNRIIVAGVSGDNSAAYEIEIPINACGTWAVVRAPFGAGQTLVPGDVAAGRGLTYKKWHYDQRVRSIVYMPLAASAGDDQVWVYRPRLT